MVASESVNPGEKLSREAARKLLKSRFTYAATRERIQLLEKSGPKNKPCSIYMMTSQTGKSYIGYTAKPLSIRVYEHMLESFQPGRESGIGHALRKYPNLDEQWDVSVLRWARDEEEARQLEMKEIANHDTYQHGYNRSAGGENFKGNTTTSELVRRYNEHKRQQEYQQNSCLFEYTDKRSKR